MNIIVNADKNWAIGKNNSLLVRIPADMKYFRQMTEGNIVVMGRKTLESFPQGRPLANRVNIVISHNPDYQVKDAIVVHSVEEAMQECKKHKGEVFVIGGESIYRAMLPYCNIAYVTRTGIIELVYIVLQSVVKPGITGFFKIDLHIKCYIYLS